LNYRVGDSAKSSATMMFGHVETLAERIEHLDRIRQTQDETGFTAFIWTHQPPEHPPWFQERGQNEEGWGVERSGLAL
jgi:2-iminoacetate synthase ThiH